MLDQVLEAVSVQADKKATNGASAHGNKRVWAWGKVFLKFAVCISIMSYVTKLSPGLLILSIIIGCIAAPLQCLVTVNLGWFYYTMFVAPLDNPAYRMALFLVFYASFGIGSGVALLISSKFVPPAIQTRLSKLALPFLSGMYPVIDMVVPRTLQTAFGIPFTFVSEILLLPVFVTILHETAKLKVAGECFDRKTSDWSIGSYEIFKSSKEEVSKNPKPVVIVLIHGNRSNEAQWLVGKFLMKSRAWARKVEFLSINIFSGAAMREHTEETATIKGCAEIALRQLENKLKDRGLEPEKIILMGHSLGGLVSCYINEYFAEERQLPVSHVVSWSAPLAGSALFLWAQQNLPSRIVPAKKAIRAEFCPTAESTIQLRARMQRSIEEQGKSYFGITGRCDHLVRPASACPPFFKPENRVILPYLGHFNIKVSMLAWYRVIDNLESHVN